MAKPVFLKRTGNSFKSENACKKHFKSMRNKYKTGLEKNYVDDINDISDLKDFLEDYYGVVHLEDFKDIQANYLLENCKFYLAKSEDHPSTECFYIEFNGKSRDFATSDFYPTPPSAKKNFYRCCRFIIETEFDKNKKQEELEKLKQNGQFDKSQKYKLFLVTPSWQKIIDNFISEYDLDSKGLENLITKNGSDENIPKFLPEYDYLRIEFLKFFISKNPIHELRIQN